MLTKKKLLIIAGAGIILVFVLVVLIVVQKKKTAPAGQIQAPVQEKAPENLATYNDEAGFSFNYPEGLTIKDVTGDNETLYSSLEVSKGFSGEKMIIEVADTTFSSINAWLKSPEASGAGTSREITLAGMPASQIQFTNPRRLVTIVIDGGIMYFFESPLDETGFWNKAHNDIVSSFTLGENQVPAPEGGGQEVIYEEEEIIE